MTKENFFFILKFAGFPNKGKMLERVVLKRQEHSKFLDSQHHELAVRFRDIMWLAKLCYLSDFFYITNVLSLKLQGKEKDVFIACSKIEGFKKKLCVWKTNVLSRNFVSFNVLQAYLKSCGWETKLPKLEDDTSSIVVRHLQFVAKSFENYFPKSEINDFDKHMWVMNPFEDSCN